MSAGRLPKLAEPLHESDLERVRFRRQWALCRPESPVRPGFDRIELSATWALDHHPDLIVELHEDGGSKLLVLGLAVLGDDGIGDGREEGDLGGARGRGSARRGRFARRTSIRAPRSSAGCRTSRVATSWF